MAKKEEPKGAKKPERIDPAVEDILRRKQLEAMVAARAMTDVTFRKKFIADPKGTLKETVGLDFGKVNFVVHEETANTVHVSLPPLSKAGGELSDDELEAVAGGRGAACRGGRCDLADYMARNKSRAGGGDWLMFGGALAAGGGIGFSWLWNG